MATDESTEAITDASKGSFLSNIGDRRIFSLTL